MKLKGLALVSMLVLMSGCGIQKAIDGTGDMPAKIDKTNEQMNVTNDFVKMQCEQVTFEGLLKAEFGQDLSPIAFDMIPFAKNFGKCASADDVTEVIYLWMKKMNELVIEQEKPTADQIAAFNHHKMQIFSALQAVSGLLPDDKLNKIIADQIDGEGRFQETALQILMLRTRFLRDVMLEASLFATPLNNVGKVQKAIEYANSIDAIARLPYAKSIKIKITGFMDPYPVMEESFDVGLALDTWTKIKTKATRCFGESPMPENCSPTGVHSKLGPVDQGNLTKALSVVDQKIIGWGGAL